MSFLQRSWSLIYSHLCVVTFCGRLRTANIAGTGESVSAADISMMLSRQLFELLVTGLLLLPGLELVVGLECLLGLGGRVIVSGYFMH